MVLPYVSKKNVYKNFALKRSIPSGLRVNVQKDDDIQVDTILATGSTSEVKSILDVSTELKIKPKSAKTYLKCLNGERVSKGDILAIKKKSVVSKEKNILSPSSGVVNLSDIGSGILKLMGVAKETTLNAGISGKVISVIRNHNVDILCRVLKIKSFKVFGRDIQGEMYIIKDLEKYKGEEKTDIEVGTNLRNSIVVLETIPKMQFFRKLATVGVAGVVVGGATSEIIDELSSDGLWGMTLCVLDAYGNLDIDDELMRCFEDNDGFLALINRKKKDLILTNFEDADDDINPHFTKDIEIGDKLFLLSEKNYGTYAYAVDTDSQKCKVRLKTGRFIEVDYENIVIVAK